MKKKPEAFMKNLEVGFVSLVDKGANKKKFAIYKSEDSDETAEIAEKSPDEVKKYDECYHSPAYGSSFKGAMTAIDTQEALYESQNKLDEGFYVLKMVMKGVLDDDTISDKSVGLKKAIEEFKGYTVGLFNGLDVQKASELLNDTLGGEEMGKKTDTTKAKGVAQGGVSANTQPAAQNRVSSNTKVDGVSKKGNMKKKALESGLEKAKALFEAAVLKGDEEAENTAFSEVERIEKSLSELEKAVGDRSEEAVATGEDTVSKNGDEATDAEENNAETGDTSGAVAKEDVATEETTETAETETEVEKNATVGTTNPDTMSTDEVNGKVAGVNEATGQLQVNSFEAFQKHMEVSLAGVVSSMSKLIKEEVGKVKSEMDTKIEKSEKKTDALTKMSGLSNSFGSDFEESEEVKKQRESRSEMMKSEDEIFGAATSLGGLKRESNK